MGYEWIDRYLYAVTKQMGDDIETNLSTREKKFTYACLEPCSTPAERNRFSPIARVCTTGSRS